MPIPVPIPCSRERVGVVLAVGVCEVVVGVVGWAAGDVDVCGAVCVGGGVGVAV